jgi:hypothetical protein
MATRELQFRDIKASLLSMEHAYLSLPTSPATVHIPQKTQDKSSATIASLSLHPSLEAALHLLNLDLPAAHFLVRHAQSEPAWEMMFLHGILHRIEGDIENARCWYGDVEDSDVLKHVWASSDLSWEQFLNRVEKQKDIMAGRKNSREETQPEDRQAEQESLRKTSLWELKEVLGFCEGKFGISEVADAGSTWVQPEAAVADKSNAMIVGGEGWREF